MVLGILIGYFFNIEIKFPLLLTLVCLSVLSFILFKEKKTIGIFFGIIAFLATILLGVLIVAIAQPKNASNHYSHYESNGPDTWQLKIIEVLKPTLFSERFIAEVEHYNTKKTSGKVILNLAIDSINENTQVDDELIVIALRQEVKSPLNPYQFNYRKYLEIQGIYHQLKLNAENHIQLENPSKTIRGFAASLREKTIGQLRQANFGEDEFGIIQALFLGQRDTISEETYTDYKNAGAVHILAVSGLHIGILLLFLEFMLHRMELLPNGKTLKLVVIVFLLWGFAFLAGLSASVVRAVTMFSFVAYALYLNSPSNTFNILALSMFFILLVFDPMLLFNVGFQMSYAAVFAIVWVYPILQKFWYPKNWLIRQVWQLLSISIAAQVGVLPISLYYFHQFPGLFFISNLLIVPFLGLILGLGIIVIALIVFNIAPNSLIEFYNSIIGLMNSVIKWVAQQEAFIFKNIPFDSVQLVLTYCLLISMIWIFTKNTFKRTQTFLICFIGLQLWSIYNQQKTYEKEQLLLVHQTKNSILAHQKGTQLIVFTNDSSATKNFTSSFQIHERVEKLNYYSIRNSYKFNDQNIVLIDSFGVYDLKPKNVDYLILTQSPKINLERLITHLQPKKILADGSNYNSYVNRWKKTCSHKKLPFHYTSEKGAFELKLE